MGATAEGGRAIRRLLPDPRLKRGFGYTFKLKPTVLVTDKQGVKDDPEVSTLSDEDAVDESTTDLSLPVRPSPSLLASLLPSPFPLQPQTPGEMAWIAASAPQVPTSSNPVWTSSAKPRASHCPPTAPEVPPQVTKAAEKQGACHPLQTWPQPRHQGPTGGKLKQLWEHKDSLSPKAGRLPRGGGI